MDQAQMLTLLSSLYDKLVKDVAAYVIATSTKVALPAKLDLSKFDDAYFKAAEEKKGKKGEEAFFKAGADKAPLAAAYVANQKALDAALLPALNADLKVRVF